MLNASRIRRVARGAGVSEHDVKELIQQFLLMKKMTKQIMRKGRGLNLQKLGLS